MKKTIILCILLMPMLFGQGVKGQGYHKLLQYNVDWDVLTANPSINPFCNYVGGYRHFISGDTTIQGNDYKIIHGIIIIAPEPGPFCPPFYVSNDTVSGTSYIREDTIAKKVFVYDTFEGDMLLYDFSLSVGDTLFSFYNYCGNLIVDSIGTITLFNSEIRNIFFLHNGEYFIEGVGGSQGLMNPLCQPIGAWYEPFCVLKNGEAIYNLSYNQPLSCYQVVSIDNYQVSANFSIYPNPANSEIIISSDNSYEKIISIYDLNGRECFRGEMRESTVIPLYNISSGLYLLRLTDKQQTQTFKIIVAP
jgi:hypothetical protein